MCQWRCNTCEMRSNTRKLENLWKLKFFMSFSGVWFNLTAARGKHPKQARLQGTILILFLEPPGSDVLVNVLYFGGGGVQKVTTSFNQDGINELILENSKNLGSTYFTSSFSRLGHRKIFSVSPNGIWVVRNFVSLKKIDEVLDPFTASERGSEYFLWSLSFILWSFIFFYDFFCFRFHFCSVWIDP